MSQPVKRHRIIISVSAFLLTIIFSFAGKAQESGKMTDYLKNKFQSYCQEVPREEVFVHSDRDEYISGEDLWFSVFLVDRQTFTLSLSSKIVYFELLNGENRPVIQKRILLDKGTGRGMIVLPDTLSAGTYQIKAYTSWMKNFQPYNCFMKNIWVYNALNAKILKRSVTETTPAPNNSGHFKDAGLKLRINNTRKDSVELNIETDNKFQAAGSDKIYLFVQTHGLINYVNQETLTGSTTKVAIQKKLLSTGINQITVFNSTGQPVAEKYIFTGNRINDLLSVSTADSCGLRSKISVDVSLPRLPSGETNSAVLSISAAPLIRNREPANIKDYLVFGTEYGPACINFLKDKSLNNQKTEYIDSLLSGVTSNWLDWTQILSDRPRHFKYPMEYDEHSLPGRILTDGHKPLTGMGKIFLCMPGKEAYFQYARPDAEGNFTFQIHPDEELKDLVITPEKPNSQQKITIESPFLDQYQVTAFTADTFPRILQTYMSKMAINHQVQTIYGTHASDGQLSSQFSPLAPLRFYGKPDIELIMSDYISLPLMSEVIFELLPGVALKKKKSGYEFSITEHIGDDLVVYTPTAMIDGVIISDPSLIVNIDPELVEKIDVVKGKIEVGRQIFTGIINVITKAADFNCIQLPAYMTRLSYRIAEPLLSFTSPDYSATGLTESKIPDYRNTLYWHPAVNTDKDGHAHFEFWSSDNRSDYVINIQGITINGDLISVQKTVSVK